MAKEGQIGTIGGIESVLPDPATDGHRIVAEDHLRPRCPEGFEHAPVGLE
jgi:hypothetical protein